MNSVHRRIIYCVAIVGVATAAAAQESSIQLPPDNPMSAIKAGVGQDVVRQRCAACHSTDYIVRQPRLDAPHWEAEVKKMISVYGARINDDDAKTIATYLAMNYSSSAEGAKPASSKQGK